MALIKCPECNNEISDQALKCPHCGKERIVKTEIPTAQKFPWRALKWVISIILILLIVTALLNWQTIFKAVAPPIPVVVSKGGDDLSSSLLDYSMQVWAEIRNDGGDGAIVMEATVYEGAKHWTKTTKAYFGSKETKKLELVFDEVHLWGPKHKYSVRAYAYGK